MQSRFMAEALELAARGLGRVAPNPMVGAVLVKAGRVVGRGWHRRFGGPHAEVEAIRDAGARAAGSTLYVTMEPCCICAKTPACTDAVTAAGISRVVAAGTDPNPAVNGRGLRCLRARGVRVELGLMREAAERLNEAYFCYVRNRRPFVVLKLALTLDGMIADRAGRSQWITGPRARAAGQSLRRAADAILVGAGTVLADDPRLTCRVLRGKRLLRVVLDSNLETRPTALLFREPGPVLILTGARRRGRARALKGAGAEVAVIEPGPDRMLDWPAVLAELYRREVSTLLIEGGAQTASSALQSGAVDKVCAFVAPTILGPGRSFSAHIRPRRLADAIRLRQTTVTRLGTDTLIEGYVHRAG